MNNYFCFQDIPILKGLNSEFFKLICKSSIKKSLKRGDCLFHQGDQADGVYIIKRGSLKSVLFTREGDEMILNIITAGNVIGENSLFEENAVQEYTLVALEDTFVCMIDRERFRYIIEQNSSLAYNMIKNISKKYNDLMIKKGEATLESAEQRLVNLFFMLAKKYGERCESGYVIKVRLTQEELASLIGVSRMTVSKELKKLKEKNLIVKESKYYILKDIC